MTKGLAVMTLSFLLFVQSGFTQIQSILTFFFRLMPRFSPLVPPPFWIREFEFEFDEVVSIFEKKFVQNYVKSAWKVAKFWRNLICFCFEFCATPKSCGVTRLDLFRVSKNAIFWTVSSKMAKIWISANLKVFNSNFNVTQAYEGSQNWLSRDNFKKLNFQFLPFLHEAKTSILANF